METSQKMLENFIKKYGRVGLKRLAYYFLSRSSNEEIGKHFGVTRQRVHQWQKAFTETRTYLNPCVERNLKAKK